MRNLAVTLGSGELIYDRFNSHAHGEVVCLLSEALAEVDSCGRNFFIHEHDFGRIVGTSVCVPTTDADEIVWAKRPKRSGHSRFVKNRKSEPCSKVVVILKKMTRSDCYVLITAFVGNRAEPEPWDRNATSQSSEFWASHALVWGSQDVIPDTETTECPW